MAMQDTLSQTLNFSLHVFVILRFIHKNCRRYKAARMVQILIARGQSEIFGCEVNFIRVERDSLC